MQKLLIMCGLMILGGCNPFSHHTTDIMSGRLDQGLVVVLPGIEGAGRLNREICQGLYDGGVRAAVQLCDWTSSYGPLYNLRAEGRNREKAAEIAANIAHYRAAYPNRPVVLVGQSGGGAMAVWIVEALPQGQRVDGVIMLAASLSPQYMLDIALSKSQRGIINFYSSRDWLLLGVGTTFVGTMDGEHTSSAGRTGFEIPEGHMRPGLFDRLFQIAWSSKMASSGNSGNHLSSGAEKYVAAYVAPFVLAKKWDQALVNRIVNGDAPSVAAATPSGQATASQPRPVRLPATQEIPAASPPPTRPINGALRPVLPAESPTAPSRSPLRPDAVPSGRID